MKLSIRNGLTLLVLLAQPSGTLQPPPPRSGTAARPRKNGA